MVTFHDVLADLDPDLSNHLTDNVFSKDQHAKDAYQQKKYVELIEDVSEGQNSFFVHPMTQLQLNEIFDEPSDALLFNFIKRYASRLSVGFVHIEISSIIIDSLLTKKYKQRGDLFIPISLAVITVMLKDHGLMEAKSYWEVQRIIEKKAMTEIYEYEFYKLYKAAMTTKDGQSRNDEVPPAGQERKINQSNVARYFTDPNVIRE